MIITEVIAKKRDGLKLSEEEIKFLVNSFVKGEIPDYQMAAFLMAAYIRGMDFAETTYLTKTMMKSGEVLDLSYIPFPKLDKHSTGGVGDKVSLILAPLLASLGVVVPMISGRALAHTGGTLDKLESIPGFKTSFTIEEFKEILEKIGVSIIGQTDEIAPADKKMYALRDKTATVASIPLIASSIMSKKLAEGIDALVLDIKVGSGAFMKEEGEARELAQVMIAIAKGMDKKVKAILTNMDEPLGMSAGNRVEVRESVDVLKGKGPKDVKELTLTLGAQLLSMVNVADLSSALRLEEEAISSGKAYKKWEEMVLYQGGDPESILREDFTEAAFKLDFKAPRGGILQKFDTRKVGLSVTALGAGRFKADDVIDPMAGIIFFKKVGDEVGENEPILQMRTSKADSIGDAIELIKDAIIIGERKPKKPPLIFDVIEQ